MTAAHRRHRLIAGAAVSVALALALPGQASAHGEDPTLVPVITAVTPSPAGLVVQVRTTVSEQMVVANPSATPLLVLDPEGEPFLRVSGEGVDGNVTNPFFHRTLNPPGVPARLPDGARPGAAARWVPLSPGESWGWFDPRVHPFEPGSEPGSEQAAESTGAEVTSWQVDMRFGGEPVAVTGVLERRAVTGTFEVRADPPPVGVEFVVAQGRLPALLLTADPVRTVVVTGSDGVEFLRLDSGGAFANPASASFRENPDFTDRPAGDDGWVRVGDPGRIRWLDSRLTYSADRPPEVVERAARPAELARWEIPAQVDGAAAPFRGTIGWLPVGTLPTGADSGGGSTWLPYAVGGGFAVAAVGVVLAARRRAA